MPRCRATLRPTAVLPEPIGPMRMILGAPRIRAREHSKPRGERTKRSGRPNEPRGAVHDDTRQSRVGPRLTAGTRPRMGGATRPRPLLRMIAAAPDQFTVTGMIVGAVTVLVPGEVASIVMVPLPALEAADR